MTIKILSSHLVNQIAAGEVLERPAAAVKELVENALDAGATRIEVDLAEGGREHIVVTDNGKGMSQGDLELSVERHATSKLASDDLSHIATMGFRGEALPSIAAVSRLSITTATKGAEHAWQLEVTTGEKAALKPASHPEGTRVEIKDLFFATPARLKFMKTPHVERRHCLDSVERIALAHPDMAFKVTEKGKAYLDVPQNQSAYDRIIDVCGKKLQDNIIRVEAEREGYHLTGFISLPTFDVPSVKSQHFFVNGRWIKDKLFGHCIRAAYQDVLAREKIPFVTLFLTMPLEEVDVNVHPSKIEIRFIDQQLVRGLLISGMRAALSEASQMTAPVLGDALLAKSMPTTTPSFTPPPANTPMPAYVPTATAQPRVQTSFALNERPTHISYAVPQAAVVQAAPEVAPGFLGSALAQVHETFIISQTHDGLILVDQHAAHERVNYETLKAGLANQNIKRQRLLIPEIIDLNDDEKNLILGKADELLKLGLVIEAFGSGIMVSEAPVMLGTEDIKKVIFDMIKAFQEESSDKVMEDHICEILAEHACKNSIKAGDKLSVSEMNDLLRQMEATPKSAQCNHGRPTYITLKSKDIEKLFGRV